MERRSHRQVFGLTLALLAIVGLVALASVTLLAAEVWANGFEPPAWSQTLNASKRFKLVMGGAAVLDKETGLVFEQSPGDVNGDTVVDTDDRLNWVNSRDHCANKNVGGRKGWRLASIEELASLIDPNAASAPFLPAGHPFIAVQSFLYWSATTNADGPTFAWLVNFNNGVVFSDVKANTIHVWCVRGDGPLSEY